jgi:hypothetical protein
MAATSNLNLILPATEKKYFGKNLLLCVEQKEKEREREEIDDITKRQKNLEMPFDGINDSEEIRLNLHQQKATWSENTLAVLATRVTG